MRGLLLALGLLASVAGWASAQAPKVDVPGVPKVEILNPDVMLRLAAQHYATAGTEFGHRAYTKEDIPYIRFFSFHAYEDGPGLIQDTLLLKVWVHALTFSRALNPPREVAGSNGRLYWFDMRWYGWNKFAWRAVAERDFTFVEPWVTHEHAEYLRREADIDVSEDSKRLGLYSAEVIVRADWFLRETFESDRSPSYYDLLFARFRFVFEKVKTGKKITKLWEGGEDATGKVYPKGTEYQVDEYEEKFVFKDFPADVDDWDKAFGIDVTRAFAKDTKIDLDFGSVVQGNEDDPKRGSMVSLHNRLLQLYQGPLGVGMRTFDVFETTGDRDFSETLIFKGKSGFVRGTGAVAVFDAGELIYFLPNGLIAGFLIDGKGKRAEIAAGKAANLNGEIRLAPGVRNVFDCYKCHAPTGGFISPTNTIKEFIEKGGKINVVDPKTGKPNVDKEQRIYEYFFDWEQKLEGSVKSFTILVEKVTRTVDAKGASVKGWTTAQFAKAITDARERYDTPLDLKAAAREIGVPVEATLNVIQKRGKVHGTVAGMAEVGDVKAMEAGAKKVGVRVEVFKLVARMSPDQRPNQLAIGMTVPRRTWDKDVYPKLQLIRSYLTEAAAKEVGDK